MSEISQVMLELTRQPEHPLGDRENAYHLYLPLGDDGRIDAEGWPSLQAQCRVRRFRPGEAEIRGRVIRGPGGRWILAYNGRVPPDELGYDGSEACMLPGAYISIREGNRSPRRFQVIAVRPG